MQIKFRQNKNWYKSYDEIFSDYYTSQLINKNLKKISEMFQSNRYGKVKIKTSRIKKYMEELLFIRLKKKNLKI